MQKRRKKLLRGRFVLFLSGMSNRHILLLREPPESESVQPAFQGAVSRAQLFEECVEIRPVSVHFQVRELVQTYVPHALRRRGDKERVELDRTLCPVAGAPPRAHHPHRRDDGRAEHPARLRLRLGKHCLVRAPSFTTTGKDPPR